MSGVLLYLYFLLIGYIYSCYIFRGRDIYFRAWMGGVFGNVVLMAGIVIPSFLMGFTVLSHVLLMLITAAIAGRLIFKGGANEFKKLLGAEAKPLSVRSVKKKGSPGEAQVTELYKPVMDRKIFICVVLPVSLIIWVLLFNHILLPAADGSVTTGQSTFGDLRLHMSLITSIAEQKTFPPDYSIMPGHVIGYPFFVDMLSSSLFLFGTSLRWAILLPSFVISMLLVMGFYIVAYKLTGRTAAAVAAVVLFFLGGGFGFAYFLEGAKSNPENFKQIFTSYYHLPTNARVTGSSEAEAFYKNIQWVNPINDMIVPQRTTMAGWCILQPVIWLLTEAVKTKKRRTYVILGILAGCMPMIHTHTFLAFGMICAVMFFMYLFDEKTAEEKKQYVINWVIFGGIVAVMVVPQLLTWTLKQAGGESFIKPFYNWENNTQYSSSAPYQNWNDPYLWFYLKNWGITALFAAPAILCAKKDNKKLIAGAALVFISAECILFQPLGYDNNKMFFVAYMLLVILVADWLLMMWDKLNGMRGRIYLAVIVIFAGIFSGSLSICREYISGAKDGEAYCKMTMYTADEIKMSEYIRKNTPSDAKILTSDSFYSPVYALTGRDIFAGPGGFVSTHGLAENYSQMVSEMNAAYTGTADNMLRFCEENDIDYVYVGNNESRNVSTGALSKLEKVNTIGTETLYKVK